jgi:hypothetical protein
VNFNKLLLIPAAAVAIGGGVGIAAATSGGTGSGPAGTPAVDVSGPCDEAEHANDPRCTGGVAPRVEDNQQADDPAGHDVGDDHGAGNHADDRGQVEDHSGPGRGGDDASGEVEDHSGPGHGGDHNSGSDHGGRDHEEDD